MSTPRSDLHVQEPTDMSTAETMVNGNSPTTFTFHGIEGLPSASSPTFADFDRPPPIRREGTIDPGAIPPVIPPNHSHRTLVVCFDGTGDQFDCDNSNIVQLVELLKKDDRTKQLVYYQVSCLMFNHRACSLSLHRQALGRTRHQKLQLPLCPARGRYVNGFDIAACLLKYS